MCYHRSNESSSQCFLYPDYYIEKNNDVCVTKNDIQSYSDDEDMLIDYEACDNNENSFKEIVDKINKDIDICYISGAKNHNLLNLTPNLLK